MSFLTDLKQKRTELAHTQTTVTTAGGDMYMEETTDTGVNKVKVFSSKSPGYIIDEKPDLQVVRVFQWLYMGSQDVAHDHNLLQKYGITHILSLGIDPVPHSPMITYTFVQLLDLPESNLSTILNFCNELIEAVKEEGGKIFVHCNAGISRSAAVVIGYFMYEKNVSYNQAFEYIKAIRPVIRPNVGFVHQLKMYEKHIFDP